MCEFNHDDIFLYLFSNSFNVNLYQYLDVGLEQRLTRELQPDPNVGEKAHFTSLCNLKVKNDQNLFDNVGSKMVQILQNNINQRYRLLIRDSHDLDKLLLNCYILPIGYLREFREDPNRYQFDAISYYT